MAEMVAKHGVEAASAGYRLEDCAVAVPLWGRLAHTQLLEEPQNAFAQLVSALPKSKDPSAYGVADLIQSSEIREHHDLVVVLGEALPKY